jgi:hypothetical protein
MKEPMKSRRLYTSLVLGAAMLLSATAFAGEKENLEINRAMTVNGTQLPVGKYTVTWEGSGPSVELKFLKGKNVVATVPAQVVSLKTANNPGGFVSRKDGNSVVLTQILPDGKKYALNVGSESAQTAESSGR